MKASLLTKSTMVAAACLSIGSAHAEVPTMEYTTDIPPNVITPDRLETRVGTLNFVDGVPTDETAQIAWDQLDLGRAVDVMIDTIPTASLVAFRNAIRQFGPDNETMIYWDGRMDSQVLILTPNTTVVYGFMWVDLSDGPMVMETPPNVLGIVDNAWFEYVTDFGNAGPDLGQGGRYILVPPGFEGDLPEGYIVRHSTTYGHWLAIRGFMQNFEAEPVVTNMQEHFRLYPVGEEPAEVNWVDVTGQAFNTLHGQDISFFHEVNETVQYEPVGSGDPEILGRLAALGMRKGEPFEPDERMQAILSDAAAIGTAVMRSIAFRNRDPSVLAYPDTLSWETGFPGGSHEFIGEGVRQNDLRSRFHFYATGITPAMVNPGVGRGSQYMIGVRDQNGDPLDGGRTYRLHIPADVPAANFWDVTVYDNQTRSLLQTNFPYPGVSSIDEEIFQNEDGSFDVYFGPEPPVGDVNWIQTIPGKGWNTLWRIYSPLQPWFDKTWRPGDIELIEN
jgi:hypothetical protein